MISQEQAARELLRRDMAKDNLVAFSQSVSIPGVPVDEDALDGEDPTGWIFKPIDTIVAAHHILTMEAIERCIRTPFGRLMIFEPPGSAKSTYASVVAPAYAMGHKPGTRVLMCSYAERPIVRHSKRCRSICASEQYRSIFDGHGLVAGSNAQGEFDLTNGSGLFAAGILGDVTSTRADVGILDDPVAGREEADSEDTRDRILRAYEDDFLSRLKPKASVILVMTRWNASDLAGSLLPADYDGRSGPVECRDGLTWEVLCLPAQCERADDPLGREVGEYLWPEWFPPEHWQIFKRNPRTWSSLYQQRPSPPEGIIFKRPDFKRYDLDKLPKNLRFYLCSDWAVTEKQKQKNAEPDYTAHSVFGVSGETEHTDCGDVYAVDGYHKQEDTSKSIPAALELIRRFKPSRWFGETGVIENAIGPAIRAAQREARRMGEPAYCARELLPSTGDKIAKSDAFAGMVSARVVWIPNTPWGDWLLSELCAFPAGRFDDGVDTCGQLGRGLDKLYPKAEPSQPKSKPIKPFSRNHLEGRSWDDIEREQQRRDYYSG